MNSTARNGRHRAAERGDAWLGLYLSVPVHILTLVTCIVAVTSAVSLASTWGQTIQFALVALATTLLLTGLPIAHAMLSRAYSWDAKYVIRLWLGMLVFILVAASFYVIRLAPHERQLVTKPVELEVRKQFRLHDDLWLATDRCAAPVGSRETDQCRRFQAAMQPTFSSVPSADETPVRRIAVLAALLLAIAGNGFLGRWAVLGMSQTDMLGYGASPAQQSGLPLQRIGADGAAWTPEAMFLHWANTHLLPVPNNPEICVQGEVGYASYVLLCEMNGILPLTLTRWGTKMTDMAKASRGTIVKSKADGVIVYRGLQLISPGEAISGSNVVPFRPGE